MCVTTASNTMLAIAAASVTTVSFTPDGVVVGLRLRRRRLRCPCGFSTRATYDRSVRRWRHLDLGACRLHLQAEIRRLHCRACDRVVTEQVPWARPGARLTRDLEDLIAFCAPRMDETTVARLLRVSWASVARAVVRVVADRLDTARLDGLYRIGVDEVSYREGHRCLTVVADHDRDGAVVWADEKRDAETLTRLFEALGPERTKALEAISTDMGAGYAKAIEQARRERGLGAVVCIDLFHVIEPANEAIDACRHQAWNEARRSGGSSRWIKHTRWALVKDPGALTASQRLVLEELRRSRSVLYRAWQLN